MSLRCSFKTNDSLEILIKILLFTVGTILNTLGFSSMAVCHETPAVKPPLHYELSNTSVSIASHARGQKDTYPTRIDIFGAGASSIEKDGRTVVFDYSTEDFLILLNAFYKIRFFDLPTNYILQQSVFLDGNTSVGTSALRMTDQATTTVCFKTADYKKCVAYGVDTPKELDLLIHTLFSEVYRITNWYTPKL